MHNGMVGFEMTPHLMPGSKSSCTDLPSRHLLSAVMRLTASPVKKVCSKTDMNCPCMYGRSSFTVSSAAGIVVDMLIGSSSLVKKRYNFEKSAEIADRRLWGGLMHLLQ